MDVNLWERLTLKTAGTTTSTTTTPTRLKSSLSKVNVISLIQETKERSIDSGCDTPAEGVDYPVHFPYVTAIERCGLLKLSGSVIVKVLMPSAT